MKRLFCILEVVTCFALLIPGGPVAAGEPPSASSEKGTLEVNTEPQGARVSLGGTSPEFRQTLGKTPFQIEMDPGALTLIIEKEGYVQATAEIDVTAGKNALMQVKLEKESWKTNRGLRAAGHVLFWPGLLTAGTGIILIAKDDPKHDVNTGMPGYITAGIGTAMTVIGGIILGLTQSGHRDASYTMPELSLLTPPTGKGAGLGIRKQF